MGEIKISKAPGTISVKQYTPTYTHTSVSNLLDRSDLLQKAWQDGIDFLTMTSSATTTGGTSPYLKTTEAQRSFENQVKKEEIGKDTRTTVEDGMMYTTFRLYNNGEQSCAVNVPKVESVQFYNGGKVAKVTFADGHFEKAVLKATTPEELEEERKEAAIAICLLKHTVANRNATIGYGSNIYNKWMERILKQNKKAEEAKKAEAEKKEADKERKKRIAEKKARKKERRLYRMNEGNKNK